MKKNSKGVRTSKNKVQAYKVKNISNPKKDVTAGIKRKIGRLKP